MDRGSQRRQRAASEGSAARERREENHAQPREVKAKRAGDARPASSANTLSAHFCAFLCIPPAPKCPATHDAWHRVPVA
ncbi:hypothetical protein PT2222_70175 [Paraburkholderia tropica]